MEKILMHRMISRAMAGRERTTEERATDFSPGMKKLVNTRRHLANIGQARRNAAEEAECGILGNYDAGGIVEIPAVPNNWLAKRLYQALALGLPEPLKTDIENFLKDNGHKKMEVNKLLIAREKTGMTQSKLAVLSGIEQNAISLYERGKKLMREDTIRKLAAALGVEPGEII